MRDLLAPAEKLAREGWPVHEIVAGSFPTSWADPDTADVTWPAEAKLDCEAPQAREGELGAALEVVACGRATVGGSHDPLGRGRHLVHRASPN